MPPSRSGTLPIALVLLAATATQGCLGPEVMIATSIAEAAVKASIEYAEKNKPTPDEAWHADRVAFVRKRAEDGDVEAQYAMGLYHQAALRPDARYWTCEAANHGHAKAQLQLAHWYNEDRLTEDIWPYIHTAPDDRTAYVWYDLAARNGEIVGVAMRDRVAARMSESELADAKAMAARWHPGSCGYYAAADATRSAPHDR